MLKPYDAYRETTYDWLEKSPNHWNFKRINSIFYENKEVNFGLDSTAAFQFKFGELIPKKKYEIDDDLAKTYSKYTLIQSQDIMINGLNLNYDFLTQRIALVKEKGIITSAYISLRPRENTNSKYYTFLFKSLDSRKVFNGMGSGIRLTLDFSELKKLNVPIPPREEQDQIVKYLDWRTSRINNLIQAKKKQIELLKEQKQAIINQAVTKGLDDIVPMKDSGIEWLGKVPEHWGINRLKNGCKMINRGVTPQYTEDVKNAMVVNQATFSKGYWDISKIRYTLTSAEQNHGLLQVGDVLLASTGGGVLGKVYHYNEEGMFIADSHVTIIRCNEKLNSKYLYYNLFIKYDLINALLALGSTNQTELQRDWLVAFTFPFPPIQEQQTIVNYLKEKTALIDKAITVIEKEIELVSEYKTSLISSVITGKVDVRDIVVPEFEVMENEISEGEGSEVDMK